MTIKECMYKIKSFEEFTPEEQQKIINKHRYIMTEDVDLIEYTDVYDDIHKKDFLNPEIYYSLSYCQGDGACFECTDFDWSLLLSDFECKHKNWILDILNQYCIGYIRKNSFGYHYSHSNTRYFDLSFENIYHYDRIESILSQVEHYIEKLRYKLSNELESQLYNALEYLESDECIKECLIANEYLFNEYDYDIEG